MGCNIASSAWAISDRDLYASVSVDGTHDARLLLFELIKGMSSENFARGLMILWAIWWARRHAVHENEFQSSVSTHTFINRFMDDIHNVEEKSPEARTSSPINTPPK